VDFAETNSIATNTNDDGMPETDIAIASEASWDLGLILQGSRLVDDDYAIQQKQKQQNAALTRLHRLRRLRRY
jgi:hypothetical protein